MDIKDFKHEHIKEIVLGNCTIIKDYYIYNDICISKLRVGRQREIISIYNNWNVKYKNAGHCLYYDVSMDKVKEFITTL